MVKVQRVYEDPSSRVHGRFLVERLWPRGMKKERLHIDDWLKDVAPSDELRRWFHHDPERWNEFRRRYFAELETRPAAVGRLREAARRGDVTLLFSAHDAEHNNAVALKEYVATGSAAGPGAAAPPRAAASPARRRAARPPRAGGARRRR